MGGNIRNLFKYHDILCTMNDERGNICEIMPPRRKSGFGMHDVWEMRKALCEMGVYAVKHHTMGKRGGIMRHGFEEIWVWGVYSGADEDIGGEKYLVDCRW